jgi:ribosomal protein S10
MDQRTKQFYEQKLGKESLKLTQILHIQRVKNDKTRQLLQLLKEVTENDEKPILMFCELEERAKRIEAAETELTDHINDLMAQCGEKMNGLQSGRFKVPENSQQIKSQASSNTHSKSNEQAKMRIYVQHLTGKRLAYEVDPNSFVEDLKIMIKYKEGIPMHQQVLIFGNKRLVDDLKLSDYNIQKESVLHFVIRLKGC